MFYIAAGAVIAIYLLVNLALGNIFGGVTSTHIVQPLLWIGLAVLVWRLPAVRTSGGPSLKRALLLPAAMAGVLHIMFLVTAGFMNGFGHSPYSHSATGILMNIAYFGSALIGIELARAYMVNSLANKHSTLAILLVAIFFTCLMVPMSKYGSLTEARAATTFIGETWLPLLAMNLLATFMASLGGPLPAMVYRGLLLGFEWFSPVLPHLTPILATLMGTLGPVAGFALIQYGMLPGQGKAKDGEREDRSGFPLPVGWMAAGLVTVAMIWFSLGLFSLFPTVIYSNSMSPAVKVGDVVIVSKASPESVEVGDVIQFTTPGGDYVHRVIEIAGEGRNRTFVTQGDANRVPDMDLVTPSQIQGRVVFNVPKVGWVVVGVQNLLFSPA